MDAAEEEAAEDAGAAEAAEGGERGEPHEAPEPDQAAPLRLPGAGEETRDSAASVRQAQLRPMDAFLLGRSAAQAAAAGCVPHFSALVA